MHVAEALNVRRRISVVGRLLHLLLAQLLQLLWMLLGHQRKRVDTG